MAVLSLIVFIALVVAGVTVGQSAFGDPASKIAQKQDELSRIQSSSGSLQSQIDAMNQRVDQLIGEESHLREAQAAAQAQLDQKQAELDKATAELNAEKAELRRIRAKLQKAVGALEQLLVQMYKSNDPDVTSVIMQSANWSDLLTRTEYIDHIQSYDNEVVSRVRGLRDQITALVNQLQAHPRPNPGRPRRRRGQGTADRVPARSDPAAAVLAGLRAQRPPGRAERASREGAPDPARHLPHPGTGRDGRQSTPTGMPSRPPTLPSPSAVRSRPPTRSTTCPTYGVGGTARSPRAATTARERSASPCTAAVSSPVRSTRPASRSGGSRAPAIGSPSSPTAATPGP